MSSKKIPFKKLLTTVVFILLLILLLIITIFLHQKAFSRDKEALATEVPVRVVDIKTKSSGLNPGSLVVTVSYQGEKYRLHGVPSNAHFSMENSRKLRIKISAKLYNGKLYYDAASILLLDDILYYAFLAATYILFIYFVCHMIQRR